LLGVSGLLITWGTIVRADIPWPEVVQRLAYENEKLARRPQGHNGEYFVVCTLYYTPKESGFTFERGFDATPVTKPGLRGRKYPRDFLRSVKKEGFGRIVTPVNGRHYIRYNSGYWWRRDFGPEFFRRIKAASRRSSSRRNYRDPIFGSAEGVSKQSLEDNGYRRRPAPLAN
jgi:hypothetical protein